MLTLIIICIIIYFGCKAVSVFDVNDFNTNQNIDFNNEDNFITYTITTNQSYNKNNYDENFTYCDNSFSYLQKCKVVDIKLDRTIKTFICGNDIKERDNVVLFRQDGSRINNYGDHWPLNRIARNVREVDSIDQVYGYAYNNTEMNCKVCDITLDYDEYTFLCEDDVNENDKVIVIDGNAEGKTRKAHNVRYENSYSLPYSYSLMKHVRKVY